MTTLALSPLEQAARTAWLKWSAYRGYHVCAGCGEARHCGAKSPRGPWLCVTCHDLRGAA